MVIAKTELKSQIMKSRTACKSVTEWILYHLVLQESQYKYSEREYILLKIRSACTIHLGLFKNCDINISLSADPTDVWVNAATSQTKMNSSDIKCPKSKTPSLFWWFILGHSDVSLFSLVVNFFMREKTLQAMKKLWGKKYKTQNP